MENLLSPSSGGWMSKAKEVVGPVGVFLGLFLWVKDGHLLTACVWCLSMS